MLIRPILRPIRAKKNLHKKDQACPADCRKIAAVDSHISIGIEVKKI